MPKKQLAELLDEDVYNKVVKLQQELKKKKHDGGQSLSKCGAYIIKIGLETLEKRSKF